MSSRQSLKQQVPKQQTIEATIFDAAQALLQSVGNTFTMEQLETQAGVSRATLYRRIGSKAKLLERLAIERGETFEKQDIRLEILKAARLVFAREGLSAATIEQIATRAGVGVATVYRHFGDKKSLMLAFIDEMTPRSAVRGLALHPSEDVRADLETIVGATLPFFFENRDIFRLVLVGSETERQYLEGLRGRSDSTLARLTAYFRAQLKKGRIAKVVKPGELALTLVGMILSFAVIGPLHYNTTLNHPEKTSKLIVKLFLTDLRGDKA